ncbi:MAG: hypothetical protein TREMPRED_005622 [Tremellales sp. Tagirdzhanova-0007]|nr:MAG: hypothetical protein TREMPRED_005622 [Tremellales sp. Tagirdzhanova-0007]
MPEPSTPNPTLTKPYQAPKPNRAKAGLTGIKNPITPPKPMVTQISPPTDWVASAKSTPSKRAERPETVIHRIDASRLDGLPTTSSLEIRIFGLPHFHADDAGLLDDGRIEFGKFFAAILTQEKDQYCSDLVKIKETHRTFKETPEEN